MVRSKHRNTIRSRCARGVFFVLAVMLILSESPPAEARQGWYWDFTLGPSFDIGFDHVHNEFPDGVSTSAEPGLLNEFDLGYSTKKRFSFGIGFELTNIVDVGYKFDFKWSFLENGNVQPYAYFCAHGGITDWTMFAIHPGLGLDWFVTDRLYFVIDGRIGYSLESADVPKDSNGKHNYENLVEGAFSFGIGMLFSKNALKH